MKGNKPQRFCMVILTCVALWLALRLSLNFVLGQALRSAFATGTHCHVTLANPRLELFPFKASVEDVLIRHPGLGPDGQPDGGFFAKRVEIGLQFLKLFHKEVQLSELRIEGAVVRSIGHETGFLNTMEFLFPPKEKEVPPEPKSTGFFARFFKDLDFHVSEITIPPLASSEPQLVLGMPSAFISLSNVSLRFEEPGADSKKPYAVTAASTSGRFSSEDLSPEWGAIHASGRLGGGKLADLAAEIRGAALDGSVVRGSGELAFADHGSIAVSFDGTVGKDSLRRLVPATPAGYPESVEVAAHFTGSLTAPSAHGSIGVRGGDELLPLVTPACKPKSASAAFALDAHEVRFEKIEAPGLLANGEVSLKTEGKRLTVRVPIALDQASILQDCAPILGRPSGVSGGRVFENTTGVVSVEGTLEPRDLKADLSLDLPSLDKARIESHAVVTERSVAAEVRELALQKPAQDPRLHAVGSYELETGDLSLRKLDAKDFPVDNATRVLSLFLSKARNEQIASYITARTRLDAQAALKGNVHSAAVTGSGNLVFRNLFAAGTEIPELTIPFQATADAMKLSIRKMSIGGGSLEASASLRRSDLALSGVIDLTNLDPLAVLKPGKSLPPPAQIRLAHADLSGTIVEPRLAFKAALGELPETGAFSIEGSASSQLVTAKFRDGAGKTDANLQVILAPAGKQQVKLSGNIRALPLEGFVAPRSKGLHGVLTGTFEYDAPLDRPLAGRGAADFSELSFRSKDTVIQQAAPIRLRLEGGALSFAQVVLQVGDKPLNITGQVSEHRGWMLDVEGRWDLSALPHPDQMVEQITGILDLGVHVRGDLANPQLAGTAKITNGGFALTVGQDILGFRKATLDGTFDTNVFTLRSFEATTGGGSVKATGTIQEPLHPERMSIDLKASLRRLGFQPVDDLRLTTSGTLHFLRIPGATSSVSGELHIDRATYEKTIDLFQILQQMSGFITGAQRRGAAPLQPSERDSVVDLDLRVFAENDLVVETNIVRAELGSDFQIKGNSNSPLVDGDISVLEGDFGSESNKFTINSGKARFLSSKGSLDPDIALIAETSVLTSAGQEQQVRMFVSGSLTKPKVEFVSEGGLSQEEIISLLGLRTNLQTVRLVGGVGERRSFVDLINPTSGATLEDRLSGITGFSEVQVDTAISGATGEVVPRLVARRPILGRVSLDAMSEFSGQQLSILNLSYPLSAFLNAIAGFRTIPPSGSTQNSSGSLYIGLRHRSSFPGTSLLPHGLTQLQSSARTLVEENLGLQRK